MSGRKASAKQYAAAHAEPKTLLSISASTIIDDTKDIVGTEESTIVLGKKMLSQEVMLKEGMKTE